MPSSATALATLTFASGSGAGNKGDVFTIAGVYRVHPETKVSTGVLQQFALAADITSGQTTGITITPVDRHRRRAPERHRHHHLGHGGDHLGRHGLDRARHLLAYQKGAFAFATADLVMPKGVDFAAREVFDGISMRIVRQYDINNDKPLPSRCPLRLQDAPAAARRRLANN
jgi:hypothetical protein